MRAIICILFSLVFLSACMDSGSPPGRTVTAHKPIDTIPIERIFRRYMFDHPDWAMNDVLEEESKGAMIKEMVAYYKTDDLLKNMPFRLSEMKRYVDNGKPGYLCRFEYENSGNVPDPLADRMSMQVMGWISDSMKNTLMTDSIYYIKGKFLKLVGSMEIIHDGGGISELHLPTMRVKVLQVIKWCG